MKIIVIGGGLIGLTSAYFLCCRGHKVTVIEQETGPGRATSFANGGLVTPSMPEPWNAPGTWRVLLSSLGRTNAPMQLNLRAIPSLARWGIEFLRNSSSGRFERNTLHNLRLALYSQIAMESLRQQTDISYAHRKQGSLRIFRDAAALRRATRAADRLASAGLRFRTLTQAQTVEIEPGLAPITEQLAGALHYGDDESGDAYRFCVGLAEHAKLQGVEFRFRTEASSIEIHSGQVSALRCGAERLVADHYLVAAGSHSAVLTRRIGVRLPVQPAKGFSMTFPTFEEPPLLRVPVIDDQLHAALAPLEGAIRVAGTAEFAGYDRTISPARLRNLEALLSRVLPQAQLDPRTAISWCGLRPMSADGVPIIGATPVRNLWVNTGHGHLGWTMAVGSGQLIADLISKRPPEIDTSPYTLGRFQ